MPQPRGQLSPFVQAGTLYRPPRTAPRQWPGFSGPDFRQTRSRANFGIVIAGCVAVSLNDGVRDFSVSCFAARAGWCLLALATCSSLIAEIISVDEITQTAAPDNVGANRPSNPPFIRSGHLAARGFSEHRIYWEEY